MECKTKMRLFYFAFPKLTIFSDFSNAAEVCFQLLHAAGSYYDAGDAVLLQHPSEGVFCERLSLSGGLSVPLRELSEQLFCEHRATQMFLVRHARALWDTVEISVGEQSLCQWRERDEAYAMLSTVVHHPIVLVCAVEHVESSLVDEQRHVSCLEVFVGKLQRFERPAGDAHI